MMKRIILPAVALAGVGLAIYMVFQTTEEPARTQPPSEPPTSPYETYIAAAGLVESRMENLEIGSPEGGIVREVAVKEGDRVEEGSLLFRIDDRELRGDLLRAEANRELARSRLQRLRNRPREEEAPVARARVARAEANLREANRDYTRDEELLAADSISQARFDETLERKQRAEAGLEEAAAELNLLLAGAWEEDIRVAEAEVKAAEAEVERIRLDLARRNVEAPVEAKVLRVNVAPGEYASPGPLDDPLIVLGDVGRLYLRVDIDENDAWRFRPEGQAMAIVRGNKDIRTDLEFEYVEPFVVPKRSLTGSNRERTDTRVLQAVYSFPPDDMPIYVGQQMDVYIEAPPVGEMNELYEDPPPPRIAGTESGGGSPAQGDGDSGD